MSRSRLILVPAIITALVTLLRLIEELNGWSRALFALLALGNLTIASLLALAVADYGTSALGEPLRSSATSRGASVR